MKPGPVCQVNFVRDIADPECADEIKLDIVIYTFLNRPANNYVHGVIEKLLTSALESVVRI
jgi:hypothetical protein